MTFVRTVIFLLITFCLYRCAVQTTPQGGPKDEAPPRLVKSFPQEKETNFKGKIVELTFDERVTLFNPSEEIIITPPPGKQIDYAVKQNKITIEPKEGWKDNTTYSISLRESVKDITEGNTADTLHLAFSTGPVIDSLFIYGRIKSGIKEELPKKLTVAIYQADTTDIFKHQALYFTKTDKAGRFIIENLKAGKYFIYAFDDRNKNLKVESTTEAFGFRSEPIVLGEKKTDSVFFSVVKADSRPIKINAVRRTDKITRVTFNKSIVNYKVVSTSDSTANTFGDNQSEIIFYNPSLKTDSLKINLTVKDSINLNYDTTFYIRQADNKALTEPLKTSYNQPIYSAESGTLTMKGTINKIVKRVNYDSMILKIDSLTKIYFDSKDILLNNREKTITLSKKIDKKILLNEKITPKLEIKKAFLVSIENDSTKAETKEIKIQTLEKTATLEIQLKTNQTKFIVQLLNTNGHVLESVKNIKTHTFKSLDPSVYKVRVIVDLNNNGKWDTANIFTRTEAEPVYYYKSKEGKSEITTRENSDIGPLILTF